MTPPRSPHRTGLSTCSPASGESAALMRAIDSASTPRGPTATAWPQSLAPSSPSCSPRASTMRVHDVGPRAHLSLQRQRYRPILGVSKHPSAMARPNGRELPRGPGTSSVRSSIGSTPARPSRSKTVSLPLERNGYLEERFFTLSYSPILDDIGGRVGGILGVVHETTEHVLSARRLGWPHCASWRRARLRRLAFEAVCEPLGGGARAELRRRAPVRILLRPRARRQSPSPRRAGRARRGSGRGSRELGARSSVRPNLAILRLPPTESWISS